MKEKLFDKHIRLARAEEDGANGDRRNDEGGIDGQSHMEGAKGGRQ
ncbi:hypothetical protein H8D79_01720 [PVC group bacterium]|nr:hypothetical protein [PVC group bacterium]